jgi:hypothetical protein
MAKIKEKTTGFYFKMSQEEWDWVERRMEQSGIRNKSAYIRKMCIDGHVILLDSKQISEIGKLLRITSNNVNQLAKTANSGYGANCNDIEEVNRQLTELRTMYGDMLSVLSEVASAKPGKLFIPPPRVTDLIDGSNNISGDGEGA